MCVGRQTGGGRICWKANLGKRRERGEKEGGTGDKDKDKDQIHQSTQPPVDTAVPPQAPETRQRKASASRDTRPRKTGRKSARVGGSQGDTAKAPPARPTPHARPNTHTHTPQNPAMSPWISHPSAVSCGAKTCWYTGCPGCSTTGAPRSGQQLVSAIVWAQRVLALTYEVKAVSRTFAQTDLRARSH